MRLALRTRDATSPGLVRLRALESLYGRQLRRIADHVELIIKGHIDPDDPLDPSKIPGLRMALERYAEAVTPWARATASRIIGEVAAREKQTWAQHALELSRGLARELATAPTGEAMRARVAEQVEDVRSIPKVAAQRVFDLVIKGLENSERASSYVDEIMRSGEVTRGRATMLARTAVSTTASALTQARAQSVGSPGYFWRTSKDAQVRPSHKRMEGVYVSWNQPPTLDGYTAHVGCYANCRCHPEVVLPKL